MAIKSNQLPIKLVFEQNHSFTIPKYQRGYAWDDDAVDDFIEDISRCLNARLSDDGEPRHHFFGGVVTVRQDVANSTRSNFEVIDGQQRLASFVMLVAAIVANMEDAVEGLGDGGSLSSSEQRAKEFLEETAARLSSLYIVYRDSIELDYVEVPKLTLSRADNEFFRKVVNRQEARPQRASHDRILASWTRLSDFINDKVATTEGVREKARRLQVLVNAVLAEDCTVIFMCTDTRSEAYQIFQVLNDRGVHLSDGDLLRARTMELLDQREYSKVQDSVAQCWDRILGYSPGDVNNYLRWYFSSHEGRRPRSSNLAEEFLKVRFMCEDGSSMDGGRAAAILAEVEQMEREFATLDTLCKGEWPYEDRTKISAWDRERVRMLVVGLDHTNAMPLLLSLATLDEKMFADTIPAIERFVFRYKTIGNVHIGRMTQLYLKFAKQVREGGKLSLATLRRDLHSLVTELVPDSIFCANLEKVRYSARSGNGHIRYFLITLEDYFSWYSQGAQGMPKCRDKTRVFDFSNTTLEHIYPQTAKDDEKNANLEAVKNDLGNLTILGPNDNAKMKNRRFAEKRNALAESNIRLNREVAQNRQWSGRNVTERTANLVEMGLRIFVP